MGSEDRDLVIVDVRVRMLRAPVDEPIETRFGTFAARAMALVEIEAACGLVGQGESWVNWPSWAPVERRATIEQGVAPLLLGQRADRIDALHARMTSALAPVGRQWGAPGPIMQAISGADQALWDLVGKARRAPASALLGGRVRDRVAVYASGLGPSDVTEQVRRAVAAGFGAVKLRLGHGHERDAANVRAARAEAGDEVEVMVDANQGWTLEEALALAPTLHECRVSWVEEPIRGGDFAALAEFRARSGLPVAIGENLYGREAFDAAVGTGALDVLQPDVSKVGGLSEAVAICRRADQRRVAPHLYGGALAYAATLQLAACCPAVAIVELDARSNPLRDALMTDAPAVRDGLVDIPAGPGLGVSLDQDAVLAAESP